MSSVLKIRLFGIGLDTYWAQFPGLKDRLEGYLQEIQHQLATIHPHIVNAGLVDNADKAFAAGSVLRRSEVELIFLYVSTYALSSTVLPVVQRAKVPVIILNLSPEAAIDYDAFNAMTDRTKMTGECCATTRLSLRRSGNGWRRRRSCIRWLITGWAVWDIITAACWTSIRI